MFAPALIALLSAHGLVPAASAGLLINEVLYDASASPDDGFEWIEICNSGSTTIDLANYQIESAGSSWSESYTFGAGTLAPGEYAIVGYGGTTWSGAFAPALQNGGSAADGVRLKDASGNVLDTVLYDAPNSNGLFDDSSTTVVAADAAIAPSASSGKSIGRFPDCADTNDSGVDFVLYDTPNPGAANVDLSGGGTDSGGTDSGGTDSGGTDSGTTSGVDCSVTAGVTINEFTPATGLEWVELYNANAAAVNLGGWELAYGTASFSKTVAVPDGTVLPAYGWIVLGSSGAAVKDVTISFDPGNATTNADAMRLQCDGSAVDTVIYGSATTNADGWADDDGNTATTSFAPVPGSGESTARLSDGQDTNQSGADFAVTSTPTPDAANPVIICDTSSGAVVRLNEFLYDPPSADGGNEWVELYNSGSIAVRLDGYQIETATSSWGVDFVIPPGTELAAGSFLLIGGESVDGVDLVAPSLGLGNGGDGDGLRLVDCAGAVVDTVLYGDTMADGLTDDVGGDAVVASVDSGVSIGRSTDGVDTNDVSDWTAFGTVTPGAANGSNPDGDDCDTSSGAVVRLNEFLYDPPSADGGNEWVELYNSGSTAVRLDGYQIETATSSWGVDFVIPPGTELAAGGFLLIGGDSVEGVDLVAASLGLGNGSDGDGLRLVDCAGAVVDTVLYGDTMADGLTDDVGGDAVVASVDSGVSIGRSTDGVDTNDVSDWMAFGTVTPGASNGSNPDGGSGDTAADDGGGGCGGRRPTTTRPGASCAVSSPLGGGEVFLAALVLLRRKRRA